MIEQTTSLLRWIWEIPSRRDEIINMVEKWILDNTSRSDMKIRAKALFNLYISEQGVIHPFHGNIELIDWDQVTEFFCMCFYRKRLRIPLPSVPSDDIWKELSNEQSWGPLSPHPQQNRPIKETVPVPFFPLEQKLLTYGGTRLIYRYEPDLKKLLKNGDIFNEVVEFVPGESRQCHGNTAHIWNENQDTFSIATGYALSEDNLWRQHSWLSGTNSITGQRYIAETTIKRIKYFGIILSEEEAQKFYEMNAS